MNTKSTIKNSILGNLEACQTKLFSSCEELFFQLLRWFSSRLDSLHAGMTRRLSSLWILKLHQAQDALRQGVSSFSGVAVVFLIITIAAPLIRSLHVFLTDDDFNTASFFYSILPQAADYYGSPKRVAKFAAQDLIPVIVAVGAWIALSISYKKLYKAGVAYLDIIPLFIFIGVYQLGIFAQSLIWPDGKASPIQFEIPYYGDFYINTSQWSIEVPVFILITIGLNAVRPKYSKFNSYE